MAETIVDGRGSGNYVGVDSTNRLMTVGSIVTMPTISVTTGSESWIQNVVEVSGAKLDDLAGSFAVTTNVLGVSGTLFQDMLGSTYITNSSDVGGYAGSDSYVKAGSVLLQDASGVLLYFENNTVPGSVVSMPTTTITATNLDIRDLVAASDSVTTGSVMYQGERYGVSGIVDANVTNSSLQTLLGSTSVYNRIAGSIVDMPTVTVTSTDLDVRDLSVSQDSVVAHLGSTSIYNRIAGSIVDMPSVTVTATNLDIRDLSATQDNVGIGISTGSIEVWQTTNADMQVQATQEGTWDVGNLTTGSVRIVSQADTSRTVTNRVAGSIVNMPTTTVTATNLDIRDLTSASDNVEVVGSVALTNIGSVRQANPAQPFIIEPIRDIFGFSGVSLIGSFTGSDIIFPGAGSSIFLKGFNISAELASKCRIFFSGGTSTVVNTFSLPNSGTVAMNLLGMEPSGAVDQPITIGKFDAGSIHATVFGRDAL